MSESVKTWVVDGMSCGGCAATIERVARQVPDVVGVKADAARGRVELSFNGGEPVAAAVRQRIEKAGYTVVGDAL